MRGDVKVKFGNVLPIPGSSDRILRIAKGSEEVQEAAFRLIGVIKLSSSPVVTRKTNNNLPKNGVVVFRYSFGKIEAHLSCVRVLPLILVDPFTQRFPGPECFLSVCLIGVQYKWEINIVRQTTEDTPAFALRNESLDATFQKVT